MSGDRSGRRIVQLRPGHRRRPAELAGADPRLGNFLAAPPHTLGVLDHSNGSVTLSFNPQVTAHPLGGAVMGKACDLEGRVKNYPGLFVVDGALIEGAVGLANPSFTIAALAERCMDRILTKDGPDRIDTAHDR